MRLALAALALLALAALSACGGGEPAPAPTPPEPAATATAVAATATPAKAAATPTPTVTATPVSTTSPTPMATPSPAPNTFRYDALDVTGRITEPGSYAFLTVNGEVVTTYESLRYDGPPDGSATVLRIHEADADGVSRAAFYASVEVGDIFEWRERDDCWVRYRVTSVSPAVSGVKPLGIRMVAYAYAGCAGGIRAIGDRAYRWAPPNLSHSDFTTAIRFGPFFLHQPGWRGEYPGNERMPARYGEPGEQRVGRILSSDLATVRKHPLWTEPDLPAGWTLTEATAGMDGQYGYWAHYAPPGGGYGVNIVIRYLDYLPIWEPSSSTASTLIQEMRFIDGRPAVVEYSPLGSGTPSSPYVAIYDEATGMLYEVIGQAPSLRQAGVDAVIAIARSLYQSPAPTTFRYDALDATGAVGEPGAYAFLAADGAPVTTYEGLRDGSTVGLRIHETDADGVSRAAFYGSVEAGDVFEWREHETCWVRYQVTSVAPPVSGVKRLGVRWTTYSVMGCGTGAIPAPKAVRTYQWSPPNIQSTGIIAPVRHGPYLLHPIDWDGELEEAVSVATEGLATSERVASSDLTVVRQHPLWREPDLPDGWALYSATVGYEGIDGFFAIYLDALGGFGAEVAVIRLHRLPGYISAPGGLSIYETRTIDGHPAVVRYSPTGDLTHPTVAYIFDEATGIQYLVVGISPRVGGSADAVIAIARSLYQSPTPAPATFRYDALDATGAVAEPGAYAFLAADGAPVTTYEGLRDGSTVALRIHETDADGVSRAAFYASAKVGDIFEWRERDDCWVRYQVTSVAPPVAGVKRLGVAAMTYAFTGCSGAIDAGTAFTLNPGPLPDLGGFDLAYPIRHGPYQLTPKDWTGAIEPETSHEPPGWNEANPVYTSDLATAQKLPYWRDTKLPEGWTFLSAGTDLRVLYGYCASWANADGYGGVDICGFHSSARAWPAARRGPHVVYETRMIEGRPAMVRYSPTSLAQHSAGVPIKLWIYDPGTESEYTILGADSSLRGSSVDAVIAIAESLFAEPEAR